jgi:hypothetical protein
MNALNKKAKRSRDLQIGKNVADMIAGVDLLALTDIYGTDEETVKRFVKVRDDIIDGYGELKDGLEQLYKELESRGIDVFIKKART